MEAGTLRKVRVLAVAIVLSALAASHSQAQYAGNALADNIPQSGVGDWQETKTLIKETNVTGYCFDPQHPSVVIIADETAGTVAYDWRTGQRTELNKRPFSVCGPNGLMYAYQGQPDEYGYQRDEPMWRFSLDDRAERPIDHRVTNVAMDGTSRVYSFQPLSTYTLASLLTSSDGGLTWEDVGRGLPVVGFAMSDVESRAIYTVVEESVTEGATYRDPNLPLLQTEKTIHNRVYFSPDVGRTWEKRGMLDTYDHEYDSSEVKSAEILPGRNSTINALVVTINATAKDANEGYHSVMLSIDGGRSFDCSACYDFWGTQTTYLFHTNQGILRLSGNAPSYKIELSTDGGITWGAMPLPDGLPVAAHYSAVLPQFPFIIFAQRLDSTGAVNYYSLDGANSWHMLEQFPGSDVFILYLLYHFPPITPFLPLESFMVKDHHLYVRDWPGAGKSLLSQAAQNWVPDGTYLPETGHNLFGNFRQYWDAHGGISQFGYPITDPFSEVSQIDGKAYTVQYFERAELELHPENSPPYDILPTLLGVQAYTQRYGEAGASGQHKSTDSPLYFSETGYTLGGKFRAYWESHGGLAQQGYPISNEFTEISPTDGEPYSVQYFQRAELELHPENAGTGNEVVLAQLGMEQFNALYNTGVAQQ